VFQGHKSGPFNYEINEEGKAQLEATGGKIGGGVDQKGNPWPRHGQYVSRMGRNKFQSQCQIFGQGQISSLTPNSPLIMNPQKVPMGEHRNRKY